MTNNYLNIIIALQIHLSSSESDPKEASYYHLRFAQVAKSRQFGLTYSIAMLYYCIFMVLSLISQYPISLDQHSEIYLINYIKDNIFRFGGVLLRLGRFS